MHLVWNGYGMWGCNDKRYGRRTDGGRGSLSSKWSTRRHANTAVSATKTCSTQKMWGLAHAMKKPHRVTNT